MHFNTSYSNILSEISELYIWSNGINIKDIEDLELMEFEAYRNIFKAKYEKENDAKKEFIKNTFEFARRCVEVICKTIAGAFGTKSGNSPKNPSKKS